MRKPERGRTSRSSRAKKHEEMVEAALARPGVREVMKVYSDWQERDQGLDTYRSATGKSNRATTTNSSNPW